MDAQLTEMETRVVEAMRIRGDDGCWSDEIHCYAAIDRASVGGVVASLVKKGVARVYRDLERDWVELVE